jgi:hypothetical protein
MAKKERNEKSVSGRNEEKNVNHKKRKTYGDVSNQRSFDQSKVNFGEFLKPTHALNSDERSLLISMKRCLSCRTGTFTKDHTSSCKFRNSNKVNRSDNDVEITSNEVHSLPDNVTDSFSSNSSNYDDIPFPVDEEDEFKNALLDLDYSILHNNYEIEDSNNNILLLIPYQNSQVMLDVFGAEMLNTMHKSQMDVWTNGCPRFSTEEIESIQVIIDLKLHLDFFVYLFEMVIYY